MEDNMAQLTTKTRTQIIAREMEISRLKSELHKTDYKAIKFAEGELSAEEYALIRLERRAWRDEINLLEAEIAVIKNNA